MCHVYVTFYVTNMSRFVYTNVSRLCTRFVSLNVSLLCQNSDISDPPLETPVLFIICIETGVQPPLKCDTFRDTNRVHVLSPFVYTNVSLLCHKMCTQMCHFVYTIYVTKCVIFMTTPTPPGGVWKSSKR